MGWTTTIRDARRWQKVRLHSNNKKTPFNRWQAFTLKTVKATVWQIWMSIVAADFVTHIVLETDNTNSYIGARVSPPLFHVNAVSWLGQEDLLPKFNPLSDWSFYFPKFAGFLLSQRRGQRQSREATSSSPSRNGVDDRTTRTSSHSAIYTRSNQVREKRCEDISIQVSSEKALLLQADSFKGLISQLS